jgi:broad specificity phosphatase PhoE
MPTFYIIRHAHREQGIFYNPRLQHQDEAISQRGKEKALQLWSYLYDQGISGIYVSGASGLPKRLIMSPNSWASH